MGKGIDKPGTDWGIQTFMSGGAGAGFVVGVLGAYLLNVRSQVYYPARIISAGFGPLVSGKGGGKGGFDAGAALSNPSMTFFRTNVPLMIEDFAGFATVATAEATLGLGYSGSLITFWGVDHDPYWIDISGFTVGVGAGASVSVLCSVHFFDDPRRVTEGFVGPS
jgi:hypothetical protein